MNKLILLIILASGVILSSCKEDAKQSAKEMEKKRQKGQTASGWVPYFTVSQIKEGIESHIDEQVKKGNGHYSLLFKDKDLKLRLVRIHTEYLANLGPNSNFACVDMVGQDGEFYDVDFFMEGKAGEMKITKTLVHKINGQPLFLWKQKSDKTWEPEPVDNASDELLGIRHGTDKFEFKYTFKIPEFKKKGKIWLPLPVSDEFQEIMIKKIDSPVKTKTLTEKKHGNKILYIEIPPEKSGSQFTMVFDVERKEKPAYLEEGVDFKKFLKAEKMVPLKANFEEEAKKATKDKKSDLMKARALYDLVIEKMRYMKYGDGWGKGDAVYACNALYGNCTDFHSYFVSLARSIGIPARFAIGAAVPSERNEGGVDGYHCWAEFYADGKWWPVDISEADKFSSLSAYYFGHHPANRVEFTKGRDLLVEPGPSEGPINFLAYPLLQTDGQIRTIKPAFTFKRY